MNAGDLPALLAALQLALDALEVDAGWQPDDLLARILVRRRHSVRLLRRAISAAERPARPRRLHLAVGPGRIEALLAGEERIAALVDDWLLGLPKGHPHRPLADHIRAETDEAARALRLMIARHGGD